MAPRVALTALFVLIHVWTTPHNEFKLMREGNGAAALGLTGTLLGFVVPLALVISVSASLMQMTMWGAGALLVQTIGQFGARLLFSNLTTDIAVRWAEILRTQLVWLGWTHDSPGQLLMAEDGRVF